MTLSETKKTPETNNGEPLTRAETVKAGAKGAGKSLIGYITYIPKALLVSGMFITSLAVVGLTTGLDPLGVLGASNGMLAVRMGASLFLGATLSTLGGIPGEIEKAKAAKAAGTVAPQAGTGTPPSRNPAQPQSNLRFTPGLEGVPPPANKQQTQTAGMGKR